MTRTAQEAQGQHLERALQAFVGADSEDIAPLVHLVDRLRPENPAKVASAIARLQQLALLLEENAEYQDAFRRYLLHLLASKRQVHLYADSGIFPNESFARGLLRRIGGALLPWAPNPAHLRDLIGVVFWRRDDYQWVGRIPEDTWLGLYRALRLAEAADPGALQEEVLEALQIVSYRIAAMGLEPELVRNEPAIEEFESPFLAQNQEIVAWIRRYRAWLDGREPAPEDDRHLGVLLHQCEEVMARIRRRANKNGASVNLGYLLLRLAQSIERVKTLLALLDPAQAQDRPRQALALLKQVIQAENTRASLRRYIAQNVELLALQIVERGGRAGEHYVTVTASEYFGMLRSAMGAGLIVGVMALVKIALLKLQLPPLIEAAAVCLNYGLGFVVVHLFHFTIATKQPAMTAQTIAATIEAETDSGRRNLSKLETLIVDVMRSQFIAIVGNMVMAFPVAYLLAWLWFGLLDEHAVSPAKAGLLLHELDPWTSLALVHAAIAGVWLFLAGLIAGYYDNLAVYNQIPQRVKHLRWLNRLLGRERTERFAGYVHEHLGALAGNFFFGVLLGITPFIGFLVGLPLDIRHVAFSTANLGYALVGLEHAVAWEALVVSLVGLYLIGVTNLLVSFTLAINVALRARRARLRDAKGLLWQVVKRFFRSPLEFFVPMRRGETAAP
ncbi:MAG: site-specific recombinase [Pseudomonadota bacterium]